MPRASWKGFLRLSLVSCPVYLVPAAARTKSIRLHRVWQTPMPPPGEMADDFDEAEAPPARHRPHLVEGPPPERASAEEDIAGATRIALRPHDPLTGEEIERDEVVKGYEFEPGRFVTFSPDELKALDVESTRTIDLATFVPRAEIDPLYFNAPYYLYPDGPVAAEPFRVITAAMAEVGMAGIGRVTLSRRERMVMVEPRGAGMVLITLRVAGEVRAAQFDREIGEVDAEMVEIATAIIGRRAGHFDPASFRDRYQEALRELIEAKLKARVVRREPVPEPPPVVDLMAALKRSLAAERSDPAAPPRRRQANRDRRQRAMLLPVDGGASRAPARPSAERAAGRRRKA